MAKPCLSTKTFATLENELVDAISPLFYAFLKTVGDYSFGMDETHTEKQNAGHSAPER